jgi:oxygen-independent coproporphyrinogen-3 oxidase
VHIPLHIYLHIPFCARKCDYCAFASVTAPARVHTAYIEAMIREQTTFFDDCNRQNMSFVARSIYCGGGTPSCVAAPLLVKLLTQLRAACRCPDGIEVTVECNPQSLTAAWIRALRDAGANRWSLGVQSLQAHELAALGRLHTPADARAAFELLRAEGCRNISVDLMYGILGQTAASWRRTLREITGIWQPEHVSLYALSVEPGTPLARRRRDRATAARWPADDEVMDWYWYAERLLRAHDYTRYEIANFARPGKASRHNGAYWDVRREYVGFGAAAHSYCRLAPHAPRRRFHNVRGVDAYIAALARGRVPRVFAPQLDARAALGEEVLLGLRRARGVALRPALRAAYGAVIRRQVADGLLYYCKRGRIALTRRGVEIANDVMAAYV